MCGVCLCPPGAFGRLRAHRGIPRANPVRFVLNYRKRKEKEKVKEEPSGTVNYKELAAEVTEAGPRGPGIHISGVPGLAPVRYANAAGRKARTGLGASSGAGAYNGHKRRAMATSTSLPALGRGGSQVARSKADREGNDQRGEVTRLPQLKPALSSSKSHAGLVRSRPPPAPPSNSISP